MQIQNQVLAAVVNLMIIVVSLSVAPQIVPQLLPVVAGYGLCRAMVFVIKIHYRIKKKSKTDNKIIIFHSGIIHDIRTEMRKIMERAVPGFLSKVWSRR